MTGISFIASASWNNFVRKGVSISMIRSFVKKTVHIISSRSRMKKLAILLDSNLPQEMRLALEYLVSGKCDAEARTVAKYAEDRRKVIAKQGDKEVPIWYSPKPGSSGTDTGTAARPQPGKVLRFTMARVAKTGKDQKWGTVLYLIARGFESKTALELGSCAGISAIYLSSAPSIKKLITVEGSKALADIARESLKSHRHAIVVNNLFDEAIDEIPSLAQKIDLAYIDGHHEKVATIHYFNRLFPYLNSRAVVIFDDISWSCDMREAWDILSTRREFSHTMDLGAIGVCTLKTASEDRHTEPIYWNLQTIVGKHSIGNPQGWKG
jgi:predicted O-methyltransferase YrrM